MQHKRKAERSVATSVAIGVIISIGISILLGGVAAFFIAKGRMKEENMKYLAYGIQFIAAMIGAYIAGKIMKQKPAVLCAIVTGVYLFLLIAANILFMDGNIANIPITLVAVALGYACACALCMLRREKRNYRKVRNR